MKICLITPAKKYSKSGNRVSALRWARLLRSNAHQVSLLTDYNKKSFDLMIALHAWRSAHAVKQYRSIHPNGPLIVALGGTDVNTFLKTDPETTLNTLECADKLVCLNPLTGELLPRHLQKKLCTILQSATPLKRQRKPAIRNFDTCFVGHLREEKDPFRPALAARLVDKSSKLRIIHMGRALSQGSLKKAKSEMATNPRYRWLGEVPSWRVRQEYQKTHLMIVSSIQEGGSNVISEAIIAGIPIIASRISGNIGLLGPNFPGYFNPGNERELADLLMRAETRPDFIQLLHSYGERLRPRFLPEKEASAWEQLVVEVTKSA